SHSEKRGFGFFYSSSLLLCLDQLSYCIETMGSIVKDFRRYIAVFALLVSSKYVIFGHTYTFFFS
ncbi:MAG: hypothetical protein JXD19_04330, partial [Deltaproteobacteria bacterium]|nr:hypothetical protein [Deltaproteobacteria bacterium]